MTKELTTTKEIEKTLLEKLPQFYSGDANKYIKSVLLEIVKSKSDPDKDLSKCTPSSIFTAVKQAVDLGLEVDARQHCHLVKHGNSAILRIGYRGYIHKIKEHYPDANFVVGLVRSNDTFSINKTDENDSFTHKEANPFDSSLNNIIGGYCYITYTLGGRKISRITTMSKSEIDKIKDVAKMKAPWFQVEYIEKDGAMQSIGEDVYFCNKARELGYSIYLDPTIRLKHMKTIGLELPISY